MEDKNKNLMRWIAVPAYVFPRPQSAIQEEVEANRKKGMYLSQVGDHASAGHNYAYKAGQKRKPREHPKSV